MMIAVLISKMQFSFAEEHVYRLLVNSDLNKSYRTAAGQVIGESLFVSKYQRRGKTGAVRLHRRRLWKSLQQMKQAKLGRRQLTDNSLSIQDVIDIVDYSDRSRQRQIADLDTG